MHEHEKIAVELVKQAGITLSYLPQEGWLCSPSAGGLREGAWEVQIWREDILLLLLSNTTKYIIGNHSRKTAIKPTHFT